MIHLGFAASLPKNVRFVIGQNDELIDQIEQWTDIMAAIYGIGYSITISSNENDLENILSRSIEQLEKCAPTDELPDIIVTDVAGRDGNRKVPELGISSHLRCESLHICGERDQLGFSLCDPEFLCRFQKTGTLCTLSISGKQGQSKLCKRRKTSKGSRRTCHSMRKSNVVYALWIPSERSPGSTNSLSRTRPESRMRMANCSCPP